MAEEKQAIYGVRLPQGFPYPQRVRSGVVVLKDTGYEGPLTGDQLAAIQEDSYLEVEELQPASDPEAERKAAEEKAAKEAAVKEAAEKAQAKKVELIDKAKADGLALTVTPDDTVKDITEAIRAARAAKEAANNGASDLQQ